jgi:hypothetical protein
MVSLRETIFQVQRTLSTYQYEEIKNHQLSSYGEWHVRKVQQNTIEYAWVVGITPKTELESLLRSNEPLIQRKSMQTNFNGEEVTMGTNGAL